MFTITITGTLSFREVDASDYDSAVDLDRLTQDMDTGEGGGTLSTDGSSVEAHEVSWEQDVTIEGIEVDDINDVDADRFLNERFSHHDFSVSNADFEVTEGPEGYDLVVQLFDSETASALYSMFAREGLRVVS